VTRAAAGGNRDCPLGRGAVAWYAAPVPGRPVVRSLVAATLIAASAAPAAPAAASADAVRLVADLARTADSIDRLMFAISDLERLPWALAETRDAILRDPILGPLVTSLVDLYRDRTWRASAYGHLSGESSGTAGVAVGGEVSWDSGLCRLFQAGVDGQLYREDDGRDAAYAARIGGCLPLPGNTVEVGYQRKHDVRPSLLALPLGRGGRYRGDVVDIGIRFWRHRGAEHQIDVAPFGLTVELDQEQTPVGQLDSQAWDLGMRVVRWQKRGRGFMGAERAWDFLLIHARGRSESGPAAPSSGSTVSLTLAPVRVEGARLGRRGLHLDAEIGGTSGQFVGLDGFADRVFWRSSGELTLWSGGELASASIGYRRSIEPVTGDQLLAEDRLASSLTTRWRGTLNTIDGYVALSRPESVVGAGERSLTAAGSVRSGIALGAGMTVWLRGELGRTMVADPVTAALAPATGARLMLSVAGQTSWQD
jgi:hypothetical protein